MQWIQSPGIKTDLLFHRFDAIVEDRGAYVAVKTPQNPCFYYGNLLLLPEAPQPGSLARWSAWFREEFQDLPAVRHQAFLWDAPAQGKGEPAELLAAKFLLDESVVLAASAVVRPPKANPRLDVRPLRSEAEWREATQNQILAWAEHSHGDDGRVFKESQMRRYRAMVEKGLGRWFGAYLDGKLVGDLGIFREGAFGRFQNVSTHPGYRRQGVCGTLVHDSALFALREMGIAQLVMVADSGYHAAGIYESVGFRPIAREYSSFLPPPAEH